MRPQPYSAPESQPYRGHCPECGWVEPTNEQAHYWQEQPAKLSKWLSVGLGLAPRYAVAPIEDNVLWRLGEMENRRRRHTVIFARHLNAMPEQVVAKLTQLVAPSAEAIITSDDPASLAGTALSDRLLIVLRAIAHIRKAGLVIENPETYLTRPEPVQESAETSLRLMHTRRVALIDGQAIDLSPHVYLFLTILEDPDGDEVHKRPIAMQMGINQETFRTADIFKRHKLVQKTFVDKDDKGHYWLKPDFLILEGGTEQTPPHTRITAPPNFEMNLKMAGKSQHVVKRDDGWAVRGAGNQRNTSRHHTQSEAERAARYIAINRGSEVLIHGGWAYPGAQQLRQRSPPAQRLMVSAVRASGSTICRRWSIRQTRCSTSVAIACHERVPACARLTKFSDIF